MSRQIRTHLVDPLADRLSIFATDEAGPGGGNHVYDIVADHPQDAPVDGGDELLQRIVFQKGPIGEVGVNGVTNETLLTVVIDRLRAFQGGAYACRENAVALTNIEQALLWLHHRTRERLARGVEGTSKV